MSRSVTIICNRTALVTAPVNSKDHALFFKVRELSAQFEKDGRPLSNQGFSPTRPAPTKKPTFTVID